MTELNRRSFLKIAGGGTAALGLGIGLNVNSWSQTGASKKNSHWADWEFYYPGQYND